MQEYKEKGAECSAPFSKAGIFLSYQAVARQVFSA
jgi:hypothetical protein